MQTNESHNPFEASTIKASTGLSRKFFFYAGLVWGGTLISTVAGVFLFWLLPAFEKVFELMLPSMGSDITDIRVEVLFGGAAWMVITSHWGQAPNLKRLP